MKRDLYKKLLGWKRSQLRKPLVLRGARQVGKTYLLKEFGRNEFENTAYLNFEQEPGLADFFLGRIDPATIIEKLSLYLGIKISSDGTLLILDEAQNCPEALNSLKYFQEGMPSLHIVAAGSLLGLKVAKQTAFPVGRVTFLELFPMSFGEFLEALGRDSLRQVLLQKSSFEPIEKVFHQDFLENLRLYYFVGGMPEAVARFARDRDPKEVRAIQQDILTAHSHDFGKYTSKAEAVRLSQAWEAIPSQLARENKKFRYTEISKNARARDYADSLQWLADAGLIHKCFNIKTPRLPLSGYREESVFKVYLLDVGLLGAKLGLSERTVVEGNRLFIEYWGAFAENYVAQELVAAGHRELSYWTSDYSAEVDFVLAWQERIFPLEVKAGSSAKKKSLLLYESKYSPPILSRATLMNFKRDGRICNYPLYAVSSFPNLFLKS